MRHEEGRRRVSEGGRTHSVELRELPVALVQVRSDACIDLLLGRILGSEDVEFATPLLGHVADLCDIRVHIVHGGPLLVRLEILLKGDAEVAGQEMRGHGGRKTTRLLRVSWVYARYMVKPEDALTLAGSEAFQDIDASAELDVSGDHHALSLPNSSHLALLAPKQCLSQSRKTF